MCDGSKFQILKLIQSLRKSGFTRRLLVEIHLRTYTPKKYPPVQSDVTRIASATDATINLTSFCWGASRRVTLNRASLLKVCQLLVPSAQRSRTCSSVSTWDGRQQNRCRRAPRHPGPFASARMMTWSLMYNSLHHRSVAEALLPKHRGILILQTLRRRI